jgi:hypothetical protein
LAGLGHPFDIRNKIWHCKRVVHIVHCFPHFK